MLHCTWCQSDTEGLNTHCHKSLLMMQGGLKIPIQVNLKMDYGPENKDVIFQYKSLVEKYYREPIDGKFEDTCITATVLDSLESDVDKEEDDKVEEYEPETRPEHNQTKHVSTAVSKCTVVHFTCMQGLGRFKMAACT